jgi:hypothetical protein
MWIITCTEFRTNRDFLVGPFGTDDQALAAARETEADGRVGTDVRPLVEPGRALAGATF